MLHKKHDSERSSRSVYVEASSHYGGRKASTLLPLTAATAKIVRAWVTRNYISPEGLPMLIQHVSTSLTPIEQSTKAKTRLANRPPVVPINQSVMDDHIVCLEDGQCFKVLTNHLRSKYSMTPAEYRARWGLPSHYPMVAPTYSRQRSIIMTRSRWHQDEIQQEDLTEMKITD